MALPFWPTALPALSPLPAICRFAATGEAMANKSPLCDARYPVIPEVVCRRPSDCQLKSLIHHDSSCQQGALT